MRSSQIAGKAKGTGLAPWQLERARRLLVSGNPDDRGIAMLARACGLSRSYFGRAFKISTGVPPHKWLLRHRVQDACEMLRQTGDRISEIAVNCGFADQSHFTRVFRAMTGLCPADWRRRCRAGIAVPPPS